jgi:hypothetical protein
MLNDEVQSQMKVWLFRLENFRFSSYHREGTGGWAGQGFKYLRIHEEYRTRTKELDRNELKEILLGCVRQTSDEQDYSLHSFPRFQTLAVLFLSIYAVDNRVPNKNW